MAAAASAERTPSVVTEQRWRPDFFEAMLKHVSPRLYAGRLEQASNPWLLETGMSGEVYRVQQALNWLLASKRTMERLEGCQGACCGVLAMNADTIAGIDKATLQ